MTKLLFRVGLITPLAIVLNLFSIKNSQGSTVKSDIKPASDRASNQANNHCCIRAHKKLIAQRNQPNRDRFLQRDRESLPPENQEQEPILPQDKPTEIPEPDVEGSDIEILINKINITGSTIFTNQELESITKPLEGKKVKLAELKNAAKQITRKYLEQGYITSRAIVPKQEVKEGVVEIKIIEGSIADIQIDGNNRLRENFIRKRLELGTNTPIKPASR